MTWSKGMLVEIIRCNKNTCPLTKFILGLKKIGSDHTSKHHFKSHIQMKDMHPEGLK